ncbi:MAG: hypothetical protein VX379_03130, partial [Pseudomonadota bacterium]|nr:hypothetical protein [Pseudomonadota bacterium]MEE3319223.1 hypothetical protein [Pseudomonadota bacterium]
MLNEGSGNGSRSEVSVTPVVKTFFDPGLKSRRQRRSYGKVGLSRKSAMNPFGGPLCGFNTHRESNLRKVKA